ncbi:putative RNA methyltransferase [Brumicola pallidula]|jgi:23S rRNA (guanine745-N1)-methyltransferase|nr:rRNA (guanine-N1)-methyltransferase [Glaciecola pallidula]
MRVWYHALILTNEAFIIMWQCPLCKLPLQTHQTDAPDRPLKTWLCKNNHSFDKAKQGYVNLLPVQNKRSKMPGDDVEMVAARTSFFAEKPYAPLVKRLSEVIRSIVMHNNASSCVPRNVVDTSGNTFNIYDSGCGEGYYLGELSALLLDSNLGADLGVKKDTTTFFTFAGHDISKAAVIAAAKRNKHTQLVVASTINIPVLDSSQDIIIQVFAPACAGEYARILHSNGVVITVDPAPKHLFELKEIVYENPELHEKHSAVLTGFEIIQQHHLGFSVSLRSVKARLALLQMTPFYWKTNDTQRALIRTKLMQVTADFVITVWQQSKGAEGDKAALSDSMVVALPVIGVLHDNALQDDLSGIENEL